MKLFLYGEDNFRLKEKLKEIKDETADKNDSSFSLSVFDFAEEFSLNDLRKVLSTQSLFADKKLIIVKNIFSVKEAGLKKSLGEFLEKNLKADLDANFEIIFYQEGLPGLKDKNFQWLKKNFKSEEYKKLTEIQLRKWVEEKFFQAGKEIEEEVAARLIECCGGDLFRLKNEIDKVIDFSGEKEKKISSEDLKGLLSSGPEADIFKTIEFFAAGDKKMALQTLHNQLEKGDDPFYILSMYIYQFRNMLKIADFYFQGIRNHFEIAKLVKLHPFVVQKSLKNLDRLNMAKLRKIYQALEKIDSDVKTGKKNIEASLDFLIVES
ncbi:MAG: DNA polymerase III subunit delta [Candidatus Moraniibacteriota bacterium]